MCSSYCSIVISSIGPPVTSFSTSKENLKKPTAFSFLSFSSCTLPFSRASVLSWISSSAIASSRRSLRFLNSSPSDEDSGSSIAALAMLLTGWSEAALASISLSRVQSPARYRVRISVVLDLKSFAALPGSHMISFRAPWRVITSWFFSPEPGNWFWSVPTSFFCSSVIRLHILHA